MISACCMNDRIGGMCGICEYTLRVRPLGRYSASATSTAFPRCPSFQPSGRLSLAIAVPQMRPQYIAVTGSATPPEIDIVIALLLVCGGERKRDPCGVPLRL
jgi:hypothetical protein